MVMMMPVMVPVMRMFIEPGILQDGIAVPRDSLRNSHLPKSGHCKRQNQQK